MDFFLKWIRSIDHDSQKQTFVTKRVVKRNLSQTVRKQFLVAMLNLGKSHDGIFLKQNAASYAFNKIKYFQ